MTRRSNDFWVLTGTLGLIPYARACRRRDLFPGADPSQVPANPVYRGQILFQQLGEEYYGWAPHVYRVLSLPGERAIQRSRSGRWVDVTPALRSGMPEDLLDAAIDAVREEMGLHRQWFLIPSSDHFTRPITL